MLKRLWRKKVFRIFARLSEISSNNDARKYNTKNNKYNYLILWNATRYDKCNQVFNSDLQQKLIN